MMEWKIYSLLDFKRRTPAMRNSKLSTFALTASIALAALAGCGGSAQMAPRLSGQVPGITTQSVQQARAQGEAKAPGGLYVYQSTDSLPEYSLPDKKNRGPRCSDSLPNAGVNGIAVDAHRILYVPLVNRRGLDLRAGLRSARDPRSSIQTTTSATLRSIIRKTPFMFPILVAETLTSTRTVRRTDGLAQQLAVQRAVRVRSRSRPIWQCVQLRPNYC